MIILRDKFYSLYMVNSKFPRIIKASGNSHLEQQINNSQDCQSNVVYYNLYGQNGEDLDQCYLVLSRVDPQKLSFNLVRPLDDRRVISNMNYTRIISNVIRDLVEKSRSLGYKTITTRDYPDSQYRITNKLLGDLGFRKKNESGMQGFNTLELTI